MAQDTSKIIYEQRSVPTDEDAEAVEQDQETAEDAYLQSDLHAKGSRDVYNKRLTYANDILWGTSGYENFVDFNFAEKHLYGRVNRVFTPMIVSAPIIGSKLVNIRNSSNDKNFQVLNFVEENFNAMSYQFKKKAMSKQIKATDPYMSELKVYKAYEDPDRLYRTHIRTYQETLVSIFRDANASITSFDEFLARLLPYLQKSAKKQPFTFPAFVKSNYCPITVSGLVIEIADLKPSADIEKIKKFSSSPNWQFYLNAARSYGFMVDQFYPWRLVADIASSPMLKKAAAFNMGSTQLILDTAYSSAHTSYYRSFPRRMLQFYNQAKAPRHASTKCGTKTTLPKDYSPEEFASRYGKMFMFRLYCNIRFYEEESQFTEHQKRRLIDECMEFAALEPTAALDVFERILNKTFDYMGSLSYIIDKFKRIDLEREMEENDSVLSNY